MAERTETMRAGTRLVGRCVPDHPDEPINFAFRRNGTGWWFGHECRKHGGPRCRCSWATGAGLNGFVLVLARKDDD